MHNDWIETLTFAQKQRLQFIEAMLIWDGTVQRGDVCKVFNVTPNHLTRDIKRYRTCHKDALEYDVEARAYRQGRKFKPLFASGSAEEYLTLLQAYCTSKSSSVLPAMGYVVHAESLPGPTGAIDSNVLRVVMRALHTETGVTIIYQSFSKSTPTARTIWPHTLVFTGDRWHVRAYDSKRKEFRDFVLTRCSSAVGSETPRPVSTTEDRMWNEKEKVEIIPASRLSSSQKEIIAKEFGMTVDASGEAAWSCQIRKSLIPYLLNHYRLERGGSTTSRPTPGQHPYLALRNPELAEKYGFPS